MNDMRTIPALLALLLLAPLSAAANGGSGGSSDLTTGAIAGGDAGPLATTGLVPEEDVECASEELSIQLGPDSVAVQVDYLFLNHGATKTLDYAFPFALGEQDAFSDGKLTKTKRFGEPSSYAIALDGTPVAAVVRAGGAVPPEIPVPAIADNENAPYGWSPPDEPEGPTLTTKSRYRWSYRVSRIEFPAGKQRKVSVRYTVPYLVYKRSSELASATSPGEFSYLLSTGGGWRGRTLGSLRVVVTAVGTPLAQLRAEGLPFVRERSRWHFEARDFKPTVETNVVIRRSEFARIELVSPAVPGTPWISPAVGGKVPATIELAPQAWDPAVGRGALSERFRLGLAFDMGPSRAQPAKARVWLELAGREPELFHATFSQVTSADVAAAGGFRSIWFDAPDVPTLIRVTFTDVVPGSKGDRRVRLKDVLLERDVSNYTASVPTPR